MDHRGIRTGILLGAGAITLWSLSSALVKLGVEWMGLWQFMAIAYGLGGVSQMVMYRLLMGRELRSLVVLPGRLWVLVCVGFVIYLMAYNCGLAIAGSDENLTVGVSLMNYLWPTLTVVFAVLLVPGTRATWLLGAATATALCGLAVANWRAIAQVFGTSGGEVSAGTSIPPLALGGVAAVSWALYSATLNRWRKLAEGHATSPVGFLLVSAASAALCTAGGQWRPMTAGAWAVVGIAGALSGAIGYMFWELALHRAPAKVLGLMGAATPILSTVALLAAMAMWPAANGHHAPPQYANLMIGAAMVAGAVVLSLLPSNGKGKMKNDEAKR